MTWLQCEAKIMKLQITAKDEEIKILERELNSLKQQQFRDKKKLHAQKPKPTGGVKLQGQKEQRYTGY